MKVGLNLVFLMEDSGGAGTYARKLIPSMLEAEPTLELTAWIGATAPQSLQAEPWAESVRWIRLPVRGVGGGPWHLLHELFGIGLDARRRRIELVHGLAHITPLIHPGVVNVATILDVMWVHYPEAVSWRFRLGAKLLTSLCAQSSARIIAISEGAREDIAKTLGIDTARFDVTPLGIDPVPARAGAPERSATVRRLGLSERPIVLSVAAKRSHKNLHGLIRALALLPAPRPQLVLPGTPSPYEEELRTLVGELGLAQDVRFLGWLGADDLRDLYEIADCFALASFLEGFGLPVLEAMSYGVPVACSAVPVVEEVAGDAALLFDPSSPPAIAAAIQRLLSDRALATELIARGRARCRLFTWERTARATLETYGRALDQGSRSG